jgi:perosamine synthetase
MLKENDKMVTIAKPALGAEEKNAVTAVIDSGMIATGAVVHEFERKFADYVGVKHGIATTSGTTALEVALRSLGIGKGDKVITTAFSFIASTNSIVYVGATPVFADIDSNTYNITADEIRKSYYANPGAKAVQIVHLFGQACDMDAITAFCKEKGLLLIEDCAQAHGAKWKRKAVGSFGDAAAFSFYPTKNMTTGEGGIVLTDSGDIAKKARIYINHGMEIRYRHDSIGYNYRMTNIAAAIGLAQLKKLDGFNAKRREHAEFYNRHINNPNVQVPIANSNAHHVYHQYSIRVLNGKRDALIKLFDENQIGYGIFYPLSIPEQACYSQFGFETNWDNTDTVKTEVLSIPVHPLLTRADTEKVAGVINSLE